MVADRRVHPRLLDVALQFIRRSSAAAHRVAELRPATDLGSAALLFVDLLPLLRERAVDGRETGVEVLLTTLSLRRFVVGRGGSSRLCCNGALLLLESGQLVSQFVGLRALDFRLLGLLLHSLTHLLL